MADITAEIHTPNIQAEVYRATLPGTTDTNGESPVIVKATVNRDKGSFELVNCSFVLLREMYDKGYTLFLVADTMFDDNPIKTCAKIVYVDDETFQFSQIIADTVRGVSTSYTFFVNSEGKNEYIESEVTIPTDSGTNDYTKLENKPLINGVELDGDKTLEDLGIPTGGGASGTNAWRKIADLNIAEDCGEVFINQDIDGKPFKAVSYYILLHSAIPTDEAWTAVRAIAVAPWEGVSDKGAHSTIWGNKVCTFNPGITNKATAVTSSACYMSLGEGMAFSYMWEAYNNGSMPDSLVVPQRAISYYFNSKKALANMNKPYSTVLQFNGTQSCFSAGSRLMVWAIDYIGGE